MRKILIVLLLTGLTNVLHAQIRMPQIFSDNMVLQREKPIAIWGWARANEKVNIQFHNQTAQTKADKNGKWKIYLKAEQAGGPYDLTITAKNTIAYKNVLVGEVWICSGQSNMEWPLKLTNDFGNEIAQANYPQIRHIKIPNTIASFPEDDISPSEWKVCTSQTAADFTAVGYFFARKLASELNVPVGLINTTWGGTMVETWTSRQAFEVSDEFKSMIANVPAIDVKEIERSRKKQMLEKLEALQGKSGDAKQDASKWNLTDFDDTKWPELPVPGAWENSVMPGVDGVVWLRKTITLKPEEAGLPAQLELAMIDDSDETYVNGIKVGGLLQKHNVARVYSIPAAVLKVGKNVIAVRITDTGGGGGIYGNPDNVKLTLNTRKESLVGNWKFRIEEVTANNGIGPNDYPSLLFNSMVNPLLPYTIQGAIWYQGEANAGRAFQYRKAFPLMISDWRKRWGQGDFPFYFVQLSSYNENNGNSNAGSTWGELREAQSKTLSLPKTGMAVTTDIGDAHDIHPRNKKDVGYRLAAIALANTYGKSVTFRGPVYESLAINDSHAVLTFSNVNTGLSTPNKYGYLYGFEIAGSDKKFYPAQAWIEDGKVFVRSAQVKQPIAVRYNWADDAMDGNLFNKEGFPAEPFRTDEFPGITDKVKFTGR